MIVVLVCAKQLASSQCNVWHDFLRFWPGLNTYSRVNTKDKDLGDRNRGVQEGQYFTVLTGQIFYGINQSMRFIHC